MKYYKLFSRAFHDDVVTEKDYEIILSHMDDDDLDMHVALPYVGQITDLLEFDDYSQDEIDEMVNYRNE